MALNIVLLTALAFFAVGVLSDDDHDVLNHFKANLEDCIKEVPVDKAMVISFFKESVFTEDKNLKCFLHCFHVKLKFVNEDGVVNVDEMKNVILSLAKDKDKAMDVIEKCSKIKDDDKCETSFEIAKCLRIK
ncbi:hypothetical protein FQR65_LT09972 [Abscondita terminalis]|nr:hypothetical protein FQR65_LT09972 [Abscondita terminalis]